MSPVMRSVMRSEPYGNCRVEDPAGRTMFRCHARRAAWYLDRGLAVRVQEDPLVVRLAFEPAGPGHVGDPFYTQERENRCVRCGASGDLTRHHIVPYCYRQHFPERLKARSGMDVLPLCLDCHEEYEGHALRLKRALAAELGLPLAVCGSRVNRELQQVVRFARALAGPHAEKIPAERREFMLRMIRRYYGPAVDDAESLGRALREDPREPVPGHVPVSQQVVQRAADLHAFIVRWRRHFLETMRPAHMPPHWDPTRPISRDAERSTS